MQNKNKKTIKGKPSGAEFLPICVLQEVRLAFVEGGRKYGDYNNLNTEILFTHAYNAIIRHLEAFCLGEDNDSENGINHLSKAISNLFMLRQAQIQGNLNDNRPPNLVKNSYKDFHKNSIKNIIENLEKKT
jgi:hypothetical protein